MPDLKIRKKDDAEPIEDDEASNFSEYNSEENNKISASLVGNFFYLQGRKMMREAFVEVYDDLLSKIERDYAIPMSELKEKYPLDVKVHRKKPRDPEYACTAFTKKGDACTNNRKPGFDFCGVHLKQNGGANAKGNYVPKEPKIKKKPEVKYVPKDEQEEEEEKQEQEENLSIKNDDNSMQSDQEEEEIELEYETYDGKKYLSFKEKIFEVPENGIDDIGGLDDLNQVGTKKEDGTILWS